VRTIKVTIGAHNVRFFVRREDAALSASGRTRLSDQQHRPVLTHHGYLVEDVVTKGLFDDSGRLPPELLMECEQNNESPDPLERDRGFRSSDKG
jgi:hypothetical protein